MLPVSDVCPFKSIVLRYACDADGMSCLLCSAIGLLKFLDCIVCPVVPEISEWCPGEIVRKQPTPTNTNNTALDLVQIDITERNATYYLPLRYTQRNANSPRSPA